MHAVYSLGASKGNSSIIQLSSEYAQLFSAQLFNYPLLFSVILSSIIQLFSFILSSIKFLLEGGLVEGLLKADIHHTDQLLQGDDN